MRRAEPVAPPSVLIPVLLYHSIADPTERASRFTISPKMFAEHMAYLDGEGHRCLTVSQLLPVLAGSQALPAKAVLVTFDDGYRDFLTDALPIMERHGIASTLYVVSGFMGEGDRPGRNRSGDAMLTWGELAEVTGRGVEVGGHTHTHPMLDTLPHAAATEEITRCKDLIESHVGATAASFAYPHGYSSAWVRTAVKRAGYTSACAVRNAMSHTADDPFAIARLMLEVSHTPADFRHMLSGEGMRVATGHDRLVTRGWRLARRSRAMARRLRGA